MLANWDLSVFLLTPSNCPICRGEWPSVSSIATLHSAGVSPKRPKSTSRAGRTFIEGSDAKTIATTGFGKFKGRFLTGVTSNCSEGPARKARIIRRILHVGKVGLSGFAHHNN